MDDGGIFRIEGVAVRYGAEKVLRGVSLELHPGERCLLLGANGSGKSTLLRVAAGLLSPSTGRVSFGGSASKRDELFARTGHVGHASFLYSALSVRENLTFFASLKGLRDPLEEALRAWELAEVQHKRVNELSKGYQARVSLCRALLHRPELLLLDEPSASLDEHGTRVLGERLFSLDPGTALIATHDVSRFLPFATRAVALERGEITLDSASDGADLERVVAEYRRRNR